MCLPWCASKSSAMHCVRCQCKSCGFCEELAEREQAKAQAAAERTRLEKHLQHHHPSSHTHHSAAASAAHPYHKGTSTHHHSTKGGGDATSKSIDKGVTSGFVPETEAAFVDSTPFLYRIDNKPKWALICLPPKAGSSLWKRALTRGLIEQGFSLLDEPGRWNAQALPYNVSARDVMLTKAPRLMLVRHPLSRLLSAYLGKAQRGFINVSGWDRSSGFRGFVNAVTAANRSELDGHFKLQTDQCGIPALREANATQQIGYRYLQVEEMGHWYREIVCALGLSKVVSASSIYWRDFYKDKMLAASERTSAAYNASTQCFVRTLDCGCELHCRGHHCNASQVGTFPNASFASFNQATQRLEDYYNAELAQRVNDWAADDMREFGYRPWWPGKAR